MFMRKIKIKSSKGFTLIELIVTSVVVGIVTAMSMPHFNIAYDRLQFRSQTKELLSMMRTARSEAISEKSSFGIYFDNSDYSLTMFEDKANLSSFTYDVGSDSVLVIDTLASNYHYLYASFNNSTLIFQPNGSASQTGDIFMMSHEGNSMNLTHLTVLASTGKTRIEYIHNY
jgi:prepilin-type N-terminal cleavage/methylation domain-containing protein